MRAVPVTPYLIELGPNRDAGGDSTAAAQAVQAPDPVEEARARIEEAWAKGVEAGKASGLALLEARLEAQRASFARELATERQVWVTREAGVLAERLAAGLLDLEARIADSTARALAPVLNSELRRQVIVQLRAELDALLLKDPGVEIVVSGPEDLLQSLREHLAVKARKVTCSASDESDVRITAGETLFESRLGAWAARIEEERR
jgi:hypothetical protein